MCGISGILGPAADPVLAQRMADALAHRGPDDAGVASGPGWALAHRRLAILDPSPTGHQPMASSDGRYQLVYNGEIYNCGALRTELARVHGRTFRGRSDTEVLLALCELEGPEAVARLEGMYAFVLVDTATGAAWAARDPFGIKPLVYAERHGSLFVGSEARALTAALGRLPLDPAAQLGVLRSGCVPAPGTAYEDVRVLPPGHLLIRDGQQARTQPGSRPPETGGGRVPTPLDLRAALADAVQAHLLSDVPVGAFLSGGLDSGLVVGLMAKAASAPVATFTVGFDLGGARFDETEEAAAVARHWGTRHRTCRLSGDQLLAGLPGFFAALDQPSTDGLNTYWVSRFAAEEVKVVLSGLGADEFFAGYHTHRVARLVDPLLEGVGLSLRGLAPVVERLAPPWRDGRAGRLARAMGARTWPGRVDALRAVAPLAAARRLAAGGAAAAPDAYGDRLRAIALDPGLAPLDAVTALEVEAYMADQLLRDADVASLAWGLELRVPFLDRRLAALARRIPPAARRTPGVGKAFLRRAFADWPLPSARKRGFALPLAHWAREHAGMRAWLAEAVSPARARATGRWHPAGLERLHTAYLAASERRAGKLFPVLWAIASYEAWAEQRGY